MVTLFSVSKTAVTTVEISIPVYPVTIGGILALQCQIWNMESDQIVKMFRVINDQTEEIISGTRYLSTTLGQRVFVTHRTMPGRITVYFMTILDMSLRDEGEYLCRVYTLSGRDYVKLAEDAVHVEVYFLPNSIYPQCQSTPAITENMHTGVQLTLSCISAKGAPAVTLKWKDNSNKEIASRTDRQDDTVTSVSYQRLSDGIGSVFICEMTSPGFPDFIRRCRIGPITITKTVDIDMEVLSPKVTNPPTKQKTLISFNDCSSECPKDNEYTILYLSVSTVAAGILCVVFLTSTIIWCYKYHNISIEITDTQRRRNITSCDGSEPVYVSLQARQEPDRSSLYSAPERRSIYKEPDKSSTYMSVEDPNNPGSKVLMPKEVFEEFYNSLSLKRV